MLVPLLNPPNSPVIVDSLMAKSTTKPRAARYSLEAPAVLWKVGSPRAGGLQTTTKNISKTGLYIHGDFGEPLGSAFVFEIRLPAAKGGGAGLLSGGVLKGQGKVVRRDILEGRRIGFAAEIFKYSFQPDEKPKGK